MSVILGPPYQGLYRYDPCPATHESRLRVPGLVESIPSTRIGSSVSLGLQSNFAKMKAQKWILANHFEGFPKDSDLVLQNEELPALKDGGKYS